MFFIYLRQKLIDVWNSATAHRRKFALRTP